MEIKASERLVAADTKPRWLPAAVKAISSLSKTHHVVTSSAGDPGPDDDTDDEFEPAYMLFTVDELYITSGRSMIHVGKTMQLMDALIIKEQLDILVGQHGNKLYVLLTQDAEIVTIESLL